MKKPLLLKESWTSYVFWTLFAIALIFYFALYKLNTRLNNIDYLMSQKNQLESATSQNSLEIVTLQKFVREHSDTQVDTLSPETCTRKIEKLLQQYAFAGDSMTVQQNEGETVWTIEDTTDYFLLQSFLLDLCKIHANVTDISMKAEGELVRFVISIDG